MKWYPAVNQVFELTFNGKSPEVGSPAMRESYGYNLEVRPHNGKAAALYQETRKFKLVSVGRCANWEELTTKLATHGRIPEGEWLEAFKAVYSEHDDNGPVGVADASWVDPDERAHFPCIGWYGPWAFSWSVTICSANWRWLVEALRTNAKN